MTWWQYLMLVNIYLLLFYGFYVLLLSRETFFQLNRIYLVTAALFSFFIPLIQSDWVKNLFITQKVQYTIYSSPVMFYSFKPIQDTQLTIGELLVIVYLAGITVLLARLAWQLIVLNKIINTPQSSVAYSFFKKIRLGDDNKNHSVIAVHENVHAKQWHSADVLIIEAVMIINWFNPIVYLYRFAIKHIHEFIADRQAIKSGTDKADYALLLLSQTFNTPAHNLVNPFFNKSLLKQRIMMLQKNKSHRVALVKYGLSVPLFILMLILSSATVNNSKTIKLFSRKVERIFLTPAGETIGVKNSIRPFNGTVIAQKGANSAEKGPDGGKLVPVNAQDTTVKDTTPKKDDKVFTAVEHVPGFPGGIEAFFQFLAKNIKYPAAARENKVQGRVIISFVIEKDGSLTNVHVTRGIGYGADEEAVRVIELSPKWTPGTQNGKLVRVAYSVPITFSLGDVEPYNPMEKKSGAIKEDKKTTNLLGANENDKATSDTAKKIADVRLDYSSITPVYILDGKKVDNLNMVSPDEIKSISVLKESAYTALYGAKNGQGVVIVTTKHSGKLLQPATKF